LWLALQRDGNKTVTNSQIQKLRKSYAPIIKGNMETDEARRAQYEIEKRAKAEEALSTNN